MGFGAGFGAAFSTSFENQRQREHEKDTDAFRYRMEDLIKGKDRYYEWKKKDAEATNLAKQYVQMSGQDPAAVAPAREFLLNGGDKSDLAKFLVTKKFTPGANQPAQAGGVTPTPSGTGTDTQMADAGLDTGDNPMGSGTAPGAQFPAAPSPDKTSFNGGGFLSQIFPGMKKSSSGPSGRDQRTEQRVQQATGMSAAEIAQVDKGYTPPVAPVAGGTWTDIPDTGPAKNADEAVQLARSADVALAANPKDPVLKQQAEIADRNLEAIREQERFKGDIDAKTAAGDYQTGGIDVVSVVNPNHDPNDPMSPRKLYVTGTWDGAGHYLDKDGKIIPGAQGRSPKERDAISEVTKAVAPAATDYNRKNILLAGALRAGAGMRAAVENKSAVLQDFVASATQIGQGVTGELAALVDIMGKTEAQTIGEVNPKTLEDNITKAQNINDAYSRSEAGKVAKQRLIFKGQSDLLAYYYGMLLNEEGKDRGSNVSATQQKMLENITSGGNDINQFYENLAKVIMPIMKQVEVEGQSIKNDPAVTGYMNQWGGIPTAYDPKPIEWYIKGDTGAIDLIKTLEPYSTDMPEPKTTPPPVGTNQGAGTTQDGDLPVVTDQTTYDAIPVGTQYKDPAGNIRTKPATPRG